MAAVVELVRQLYCALVPELKTTLRIFDWNRESHDAYYLTVKNRRKHNETISLAEKRRSR
jgi:hypothetical protein